MAETTCEKCGHIIQNGEWPFCPHPATGSYTSFTDEIPGGVVCENYGPQPVTFYSHSERRKYMEANGLREKETFSPRPGTDKDPQGIPNPAGYMDPYTLENARILVSRQAEPKSKPFDGVESGVLRNLTSTVVTDPEEVRRATQ